MRPDDLIHGDVSKITIETLLNGLFNARPQPAATWPISCAALLLRMSVGKVEGKMPMIVDVQQKK